MKVLIITQIVDTQDPVLGFFHEWVRGIAAQADGVELVGLKVGTHNVPPHVTVHSLGKEVRPRSTFSYTLKLWSIAWRRRQHYDIVFAHMNPEYVIAGGWLWKLLGKPITMWYAHGAVSWRLRVATWFSNIVFTSTASGFRYDIPKRHIIGQGIDTEKFSPKAPYQLHEPMQLLSVGRIAPSKQLETLIAAVALLVEKQIAVHLTLVGGTTTDSDVAYLNTLKEQMTTANLNEHVTFLGALPQHELPERLRAADIFISDGATGSLDKALLEAMSSGCMVISSNESFSKLVPHREACTFPSRDSVALSDQIMAHYGRSDAEREAIVADLRTEVIEHHSLHRFTETIANSLATLLK